MTKIVTVVGARPQFIKAAAVSRVLRARPDVKEILIHTGQHYDANMSDIFFSELHIPRPDYNLGVGSGPHGKQTGEMLAKTEKILLAERPDAVLVYGDTNSTLAGALAAAKLHLPVAHVEAGLRSFNRSMPEELNRVLTDHLAAQLFCPTAAAVENLAREGITQGVTRTGDVMCDALFYYRARAAERYAGPGAGALRDLFGSPDAGGTALAGGWYLATIHRAENTDGEANLAAALAAFEQLDLPVVFPVHPRTEKLIEALLKRRRYRNIRFVEPVGYLHMINLAARAKKIVTDSGGLQKEAYLLGVPCVTVREQTEWTETLAGGWNVLARADTADILEKVRRGAPDPAARTDVYGNGHAAETICGTLLDGRPGAERLSD